MRTLFLLTILISSQISFGQSLFGLFGYSSYEECMKEEIKDNGGKSNSYIDKYCRDKFPRKTDYSSYKYPWDKWDDFKFLDSAKYSFASVWNSTTGDLTVTVMNKSKDKTIKMLRTYRFISDDCGNSTVNPKKSDWDYKSIRIGPGQKREISWGRVAEFNCYKSSARTD